jgi:large subunit ribosomal protein L29
VKAKELRDLSLGELKQKEKDLSQEIFSLRLQRATGQVANTAGVEKVKRDLARVKTVLREIAISKG